MTTNPSHPAPEGASVHSNPEPRPARGPLARGASAVVRLLFVVSLVLFLVGGFVIVGAQAVQTVLGDGTAVASIGERLGPTTFAVSAVCGLLAFVMEYGRTGDAEEGSD